MPVLDKVINGPAKVGTYNGYGLPRQAVSVKDKEDPRWGKQCMDFLRDEARAHSRDKIRDAKKFQMLSDEYDYSDHLWSIDPLHLGDKKEEEYGGTEPIQHYPIINTPLNTIHGERINRNIQFYCLSETPKSRNTYYQAKTEELVGYVQQEIMNTILQRMQAQGIPIDEKAFQKAQQMAPEQIQKYVDSGDYGDAIEDFSNTTLKNLWKDGNLDEEFIEGFRGATVCGKEFYTLHVVGNKLNVFNVNSMLAFYHKSSFTRYISESQYAGYRMFLTPSSIIDMYRDRLTDEDIDELERKMSNGASQGNQSITGLKSISYDTQTFTSAQGETLAFNQQQIDSMLDEFWQTGSNTGHYRSMQGLIEVVQGYWKSYRKVGWLTWYDEADEEHEDLVDENYEPDENAGESVKWFYLNQVYQGTVIDENIYVGIEPYPFQLFDLNDPDYSPLPIEGGLYNDYNGKTMGLVDYMLPWQELFDIVANELKKDMKKAFGKVMYMDMDSIPNIEGFDEKKWYYWAKEFGIAWVSSNKGKNSFSHYQAADMSFAEQMNAKIALLDKIKNYCDAFAGFSQPRVAGQSSQPTAQQDLQQMQASVNQTEYFFWKHTQIIQRVLTQAINISKRLVKKDPYLRNKFDEVGMKYIEFDLEDVQDANLSVYVVHSSQEIARREMLRQMAISAASKGADMVDCGDLVMAKTENEIRRILKNMRAQQQQILQQQQQFEADQEQAKRDQADRYHQDEVNLEYDKIESQERQTFMKTFAFQDDNLKDENANGIPDILETAQLEEQRSDNLRKHVREVQKNMLDAQVQRRKLSIEQQKLGILKEKNKIDLKNQKNDKDIALIQARHRAKSSKK
jgi:hypothetical protein